MSEFKADQDAGFSQASLQRPWATPETVVQTAIASLLAATVLFNPLLAIVNAHLLPVSGGMVAAIQAGLVGAAFALSVLRRESLPLRWILVAWALLFGNVLLALARGEFNPKFFADVLTIAAFICVGARLELRVGLTVLVALQMLIALCGAWELQFVDGYSTVFDPRSYYINSRGLSDQDFWAQNDLYVSSVRPDGRLLLSWTDYHRGSSLFLEPVSLGNWTILVTVLLIAFWGELKVWQRAALIVGNVVCLCVCDGRLALVTSLLLAVALPVLRHVPSTLAAFTPAAFWAAVLALDHYGYLEEQGDTFPGRLRYSLDVMGSTQTRDLFGLRPFDTAWWDAGFAYVMQTQSLFIALGLWLVLMLTDIGEDARGRTFKYGAAIFITLCLSVSYSLFSIKVVAVLWAFYGVLWQMRRRETNEADQFAGILRLSPLP